MASDLDFVRFVVGQIGAAGVIEYKKMFGEYLVYCDGKPVVLICDNTAFVKMLDGIADLTAGFGTDVPYTGAKPHYVLDNLDDSDFLSMLIGRIKDIVPAPKPKKKKLV